MLWVEPYPVRLPRWSDLSRPPQPAGADCQQPSWLELLQPMALPLEPLAAGRALNRKLWWPRVMRRLLAFAAGGSSVLAIGKPSDLARHALRQLPAQCSLYDAMDDFPAFHKGRARATAASIERDIIQGVAICCATSSHTLQRFQAMGVAGHLIANGLASDRMPAPSDPAQGSQRPFGYVGTVGAWFDWAWVCELATDWPSRRIEIYGPVHQRPPAKLPTNVVLGPALAHPLALERIRGFAAGLIPFHRTELTASVDPVKYYEYRALGLPVISTPFGEMLRHAGQGRVLLTAQPGRAHDQIADLLEGSDTAESVARFRQRNGWSERFEPLAALLNPTP